MGARHPQDLIVKTGASKYDFIVACNLLVRTGIVKKPADAIRYIETNDVSVQEIIDNFINEVQQAKLEEAPSDVDL